MTPPKHPRKYRRPNPAVIPQLIDLANASVEAFNESQWSRLTFTPGEVQFVPAGDGRPRAQLFLERGGIEVRIEFVQGFDVERVRATLVTPSLLKRIEPAAIHRVSWRYMRDGGFR